jgi:hypothetical protein
LPATPRSLKSPTVHVTQPPVSMAHGPAHCEA